MTKSETNRMNAQKSTGARTAEGKATVAKNAIKHGIFAKAALLSNENKAEFDALLTDLKTDLQPQGVLQSFLVEKIASAMWRQKRLLKAETAAFELSQCESNIKFKESACTALGLSALDAYKPMHFPKPETYYTEIYKAYDKNPPQTVEDLDCHTELKEWFFEDMRAMTEAETDEEKIKEWSEDNSFADWLEETIAHIRIKAIEEMEQARRYALKDTIKQAALPSNELLSRYAVTLDNELYKAIDAFNKAGT